MWEGGQDARGKREKGGGEMEREEREGAERGCIYTYMYISYIPKGGGGYTGMPPSELPQILKNSLFFYIISPFERGKPSVTY